MRLNRTSWTAGVVFAAVAAGLVPMAPNAGQAGLGFVPATAHAQTLGSRVVSGFVTDESSTPVAGATVFLKNLKTKSIRSFTSVAEGKFRFAQVNMADDQELWAEKDGKKSAVKSISPWDTRKEFEVELKLK